MAGFDGKFILQWCLKHDLHPSRYIRNGSRIMCMEFKKFNIRFIDSLHFFLQPLAKLSATYSIDTIKGHFPHHFNKHENQNYIGKIPSEEMFGVKDMCEDVYKKEFKPWYETVKDKQWNYKEEMIKYCRADVELLSKAILKFKQMFQDKFDINPFKYITLASLCMAIFRGNFLEDDTIVANEQNKPVSKVCKEWLIHKGNDKKCIDRSTNIY